MARLLPAQVAIAARDRREEATHALPPFKSEIYIAVTAENAVLPLEKRKI